MVGIDDEQQNQCLEVAGCYGIPKKMHPCEDSFALSPLPGANKSNLAEDRLSDVG